MEEMEIVWLLLGFALGIGILHFIFYCIHLYKFHKWVPFVGFKK